MLGLAEGNMRNSEDEFSGSPDHHSPNDKKNG